MASGVESVDWQSIKSLVFGGGVKQTVLDRWLQPFTFSSQVLYKFNEEYNLKVTGTSCTGARCWWSVCCSRPTPGIFTQGAPNLLVGVILASPTVFPFDKFIEIFSTWAQKVLKN